MSTEIAVIESRPRRLRMSLDEIVKLANILHKGGLCPRDCSRPEALAVRIIAGDEVGLSPVYSVGNIMVLNGKASIWGDAALAVVRSSGLLESIAESLEGDGDYLAGLVVVRRKGEPEREFRFSVGDARTAELWQKKGPWTAYPKRMLLMRARAFALRDVFPDVLAGLGITEEEQDIPTVVSVRPNAEPVQAIGYAPAMITAEQLEAIGRARFAWLRALGVDKEDGQAVSIAWLAKLSEPAFAVQTARELTTEQAAKLLADLETVGHRQTSEEVLGEAATA